MNYKTCLTLLFLSICLSSMVYGQVYNFHDYTVDNGFPQANADDIIQDKLGYIYVATQVGVVRFDGTSYTIFDESDGLSSNVVVDLFQAADSSIWISTRNGISVYNYDTILAFSTADGLPGTRGAHIWEDLNQRLWVMTRAGLSYYTDSVFVPVQLPDSNLNIYAHAFFNDSVYLGTNKGVLIQSGDTTYRRIYPQLSDFKITALDFDSLGNLWCAAPGTGLIRVTSTGYRILNGEGVPGKTTETLLIDSQGTLWVGTEGQGVYRFEGKQFRHFGVENGMDNASVLHLMEDKERNIWIGGRSGIMVYNPTNPFIHYPQASLSSKGPLMGLMQDHNNHYWFASFGDGLSMFDGSEWHYYTREDGLKDNRLFSVFEDSAHNIWISTGGHGIAKYNRKSFEVFDKTNQYKNVRVFKVFPDHKGNIWGCTQFEGVFKYDGENFKAYTTRDGLPDNNVMSAYVENDSIIWFGTINSGLVRYDANGFHPVHIIGDTRPRYIRSICADSSGNIWFGTASKGVCQLIKQKNGEYGIYQVTVQNGLNSNNIYFVISDGRQQIWAGTEKGINRIVLNDEQKVSDVYTYGKAEGFVGVETSINGAMVDHMGHLWFTSSIGATRYKPGVEKENKKPPQTHITGLKLFYKPTKWKQYAAKTNLHQLPENLELPHTKNHLTFQYVGLSFTNPQEVNYQYKLEGLDKNWSPETQRKEAVYANIPPGTYTFKVKACNNDNIWNKAPATFSFTIQPPFWQETWFYVLSVIIVLLFIAIYIQFRINSYKEAKKVLEQKVNERTKEIEQQKQEIQEKNEELNQRNEEIASQRDELEIQRDKVSFQKDKIEELFREQTNSIKYARHIQKAILPAVSLLDNHFSRHFILFRPLSIVSGDFYYLAEHNNWLIVAAVDSTGHGVPGGFMSMLGMSFLNEIVYSMAEVEVDIILNKLRKYVIRSLKQKGIPGEHKEGMEMSVIAVDTTNYVCQFAGARSSALLVRNNHHQPDLGKHLMNDKDNGLFYFVPDAMPVSVYPKMEPFTKNVFSLFPGDKLYLFTDGYEDQIREGSHKKFSSRAFQKLLLQTAGKGMNKQRQLLLKSHLEWKGNGTQTDDILVIGLEV